MTRFQSRCQRLVSGIPEPGMGDAIIEPYCRQAWNRWNVWKHLERAFAHKGSSLATTRPLL